MDQTDLKNAPVVEDLNIKANIYEKVPFTDSYDTHITIDELNTEDWNLKSLYIQQRLKDMGIFPEVGMMSVSDSALVGYTYPQASAFEAGLFFTNKIVEKNMMVGLPGCGGEGANDRPYFGILVYKAGEIELCLSYGNHVCKPLRVEIERIGEEEEMFIRTLLKCWEPVKSL